MARDDRPPLRVKIPNPAKLVGQLPFPYRAPTVPDSMVVPPTKSTKGIDYDTRWARSYPARFARVLLLEGAMRPLVRVVADPDRTGTDRLEDLKAVERPDGLVRPVIFAANHHSHVDTPLLLTSIPEPWRHRTFVAAAADYFFGTRFTSVTSALALNAIPIERTKVNRRSADDSAALIEDGWSLVIFPEGGRSPDGWGQEFRGGAAYLALRTGVPVVPVHLEGTGRVLPKGTNKPKRSATTVTFGSPLVPDEGEDSRRFAARIERAVAVLAQEATSDFYTARLQASRGETPGLTGPGSTSWRRTWALGDRGPRKRRVTKRRWPDLD